MSAAELRAQETLPGDTAESATEPATEQRIVEGRPPLHSLQRNAHPLTWLDAALHPIVRSAESGWLQRMMVRKPDTDKVSGVRFGVGMAGTSSGFGPKVTFFHKNLLGRGLDVNVPLLYTYSHYQVYEANASVPISKLRFEAGTGYYSRARDDYFGLGNDSREEDEAQLRTVTREVSTGFSAKLDDHWASGLHLIYRSVGVTKPTWGTSAQDHFDEASTPGLFGAKIGSAVFSIGHDTEKRENYQFKGGSDHLQISFNRGLSGSDFDYWGYRLYSQHFFPVSDDGRKVIAARALVETNLPSGNSSVPFFDMPVLGADQALLRGFENFRFRDKSAIAATLEYRYRIWTAMDMGLFVDQGQVAPQLGDMSWNRFHTGYGARFFVWPKPTLPISIDYGRSKETWRMYFRLNTTW